jgi:peptidoglycan/LPS O-acetylase OafA/YrhL
VIKIRWKYVASAVYVLIFVTSLTVAFFGQVDAIHDHDDVLWGVSTGLFITGACAAIYSIFSRGHFYLRVGLMAGPFFLRGALYATIPESLPDHNEWAASSINVLCGVLIILMEAFDTDDVR